MDPVEHAVLQDQVARPDVFTVKSSDGFWTYLSELHDGSWLVEYDVQVVARDGHFLLVGPFGPRERSPNEAPLSQVGRVGLSRIASDERTARLLAALLSAHSVSLSELHTACEAPDEPMRGVLYEITDDGVRSGTFGTVHFYSDESVFQFETGDEVDLDTVKHALWPAGGSIDPAPDSIPYLPRTT